MIRHKFTSPKTDGTDATLVRPTNWNDTHSAPPYVVTLVGASTTWTNMPSAATEFMGTPRTKYDLTNADNVRIVANVGVIGNTGATLKIQYSTDETNWFDLTGTVTVDVLNTRVGAWVAVPAGAKGDVFVRILGAGGNGVIDPQFRLVQLQVQ